MLLTKAKWHNERISKINTKVLFLHKSTSQNIKQNYKRWVDPYFSHELLFKKKKTYIFHLESPAANYLM